MGSSSKTKAAKVKVRLAYACSGFGCTYCFAMFSILAPAPTPHDEWISGVKDSHREGENKGEK